MDDLLAGDRADALVRTFFEDALAEEHPEIVFQATVEFLMMFMARFITPESLPATLDELDSLLRRTLLPQKCAPTVSH